MQNDEIVHVLYVARGRIALSERKALERALTELEHEITTHDVPLLTWILVTSQKAAMFAARGQAPGVAVIEFHQSPGREEFCAQLLQRWPSVRLVAVTNEPLGSLGSHFEKCIPYPMVTDVLYSAISEMLHTVGDGYLVQAGEVSLDMHNRIVITPRGEHHMTPKQCALLYMLMTRRNEVVSRREIMQEIWQTNFLGDTRTLDVHIRWLRERIEFDPSNPRYLITVRGRGYRFASDGW